MLYESDPWGPAKPQQSVIVYDVESGLPVEVQPAVVVPAEGYSAFADRAVRQGFIRKVFGADPPLPPVSSVRI